jgi:hypothetical protein
MEKKNVDARTRELSGASGGDAQYLGQYPKALSQIIAELSDEKIAEYTQLAEDWNREGASESAKRKSVFSENLVWVSFKLIGRNAEKRLGKEIKSFTKLLDEQMGAKVFMLVGFRDESGEIHRAK